MQARYVRSLFLLLLLNLLIKPLWLLGIDRGVQNTAGTASYGLYYALFNFSFYLLILLDPGLHTYNNQSLARQPALLSENLSQYLPIKLGLSLLYLLLTVVAAAIFGYRSEEIMLLVWIGLFQVFTSFILFMRSFLTGLHLFNTDSIFSVLDRCLMLGFGAWLLWSSSHSGGFEMSRYAYAQVAATGIAAVVISVVIFSKLDFFRPIIRWKSFVEIIRLSYPFALLGILMVLYSRVDSVMLERMLPDGAVQAGTYAQSYRFLEAANMMAFLFATILLPLFTGVIHRRESVGAVVSLPARLLLFPAFLLSVACFAYRGPLMSLLYRQSTAESAQVFGWLMLTFIPVSGIYIYGTLLTAAGNLRFLNITAAGGVAVNILLNFYLIPRYQALGAVAATLATQTGVSLLHFIKSHRLFALKIQMQDFFKGIIFVAVALLGFGFLRSIAGNWLWNMLLLLGINLIFAVLLGLIKLKSLATLFKIKDNDRKE